MPISPESQGPKVYGVQELTEEIRDLLEGNLDFVWVEGEISNFSAPRSGHYYMVLKDVNAQIRAVMFRLQAGHLKFLPENGMKVIAQGRVGVYAPRGEYQLILDYLEPIGVGALALAFDQVKNKLAKQGVFDQAIKKPLPFLPKRIALITSPTGAAVRDFLNVVQRRFANLEISILPVRVQGEQACGDIIKALEAVNRDLNVDVIVLTRGGGSLEDLWAFNEEALALAVRRSRIPVVSAVGHEIDVTICDLASDFRAPTPSAAAELLVTEKAALKNRLNDLQSRLVAMIRQHQNHHREVLEKLKNRLRDPRKRLADAWIHLDDLQQRLIRLIRLVFHHNRMALSEKLNGLRIHSPKGMIASGRQNLDFQRTSLIRATEAKLRELRMRLIVLEKGLGDLNPMAILNRGYSIAFHLPEKRILKEVSAVRQGDQVMVLLGEGRLTCRVETAELGSGFSLKDLI
ncbi:MAG: exodeoxyribonuclease VII large subunit [Deltaproteobacteria bacterium]|nr:exodeoxyribonuclease VII large subunit [Deltaproteobacteria bacterium]